MKQIRFYFVYLHILNTITMEINVRTLNLSSLPEGSFIRTLATTPIRHKGEYTCDYKGVPTRVVSDDILYEDYLEIYRETIIPYLGFKALRDQEEAYRYSYDKVEKEIHQAICEKLEENKS